MGHSLRSGEILRFSSYPPVTPSCGLLHRVVLDTRILGTFCKFHSSSLFLNRCLLSFSPSTPDLSTNSSVETPVFTYPERGNSFPFLANYRDTGNWGGVGGVKNVNEESIDYDLFAYLPIMGLLREDSANDHGTG